MIEVQLPDVDLSMAPEDLRKYYDTLRLNPGGVYAFYDDKERCLYVGKSKALHNRLQGHRNSPFYRSIVRIDVRFVRDPVARDIYETYAINELKAVYNRDKVKGATVPAYKFELIEQLYVTLDALETLENDILTEMNDLEVAYGETKRPKAMNNFTGDVSQRFLDYIECYDTDRMRRQRNEMAADVFDLNKRLRDVQDEIAEVTDKLESIYEEISV